AFLRSTGRSPRTINKIVRLYLSTAFEKARVTGKIRYNPIRATRAEREESRPKATFTPVQVAQLLEHASPDWQGAILFAYNTGARLSDVVNLKWSNLDVGQWSGCFHSSQGQESGHYRGRFR